MKFKIGQKIKFFNMDGIVISYHNEKKQIYKIEVENKILFPHEKHLQSNE
jgi:hypothetical protein